MIELQIDCADAPIPLRFNADHLICCGWAGRDRAALQAHVDELALLGVPPPTRVPTYMNLSTYLLTAAANIDVVSDTTSGEVEYVLLRLGDRMWVTVGSDHTDRHIEGQSIVASKQMCAKYLAGRCWPYDEVAGHWDRLVLRCWITKGGRRTLYQDSPLASILGPQELLKNLPEALDPAQGVVLYSGTIPTKVPLIYGDAYELALEDPVRRRRIGGEYRVTQFAQHV